MNMWSKSRTRSAFLNWGILFIILLLVATITVTLLTRGQTRIANQFVINVGVVVAMQSFVGATGILSFGHIAFLCVAAYTTGLVTIPVSQKEKLLPDLPEFLMDLELGLPAALIVTIIVVFVIATLFGGPISRMRQSVIPMATLAMLVIVYTVTNLWDGVTRGTRGLVSVPPLSTTWTILIATSVIIIAALLFKASPWGLQAQAVREDEVAAASFGISVARTRFIAWIFSAGLMSIAGTMWALNSLAFSPEQFFFAETFSLLAMLVIGGMGSVSGALIGVAAITLIGELLRSVEQGLQVGSVQFMEMPGVVQFTTAVLIIVLLIIRPKGLLGNGEIGGTRWPLERGALS